ncbi:MAG: coenzyme F420-0:L-glutamate ligase [Candidatus Paceibacterota bacterium]
MQLIPVKTRILTPPQDDLLLVLKESLPKLQNGDIVLVSSKVVAINEGCTVEMSKVDKDQLVTETADLIIPRPYWSSPLTVAHHTFLGAAGIDESNGNGFYIKLPKDLFNSATNLRTWLMNEYGLEKLGVIITDSHSSPFRFGATGVALAWRGIEPIEDCRGREDLFGRKIEYERSNFVDGLASAATVLMGEVDECTPVVVVRGVPRIVFTEADTKDQLFVDFKDDTFRILYEKFLPKK